MDIATAMYKKAWNRNPLMGMVDFVRACCFSCTQTSAFDCAMHPISAEMTSKAWADVSDFPEYCPMANKPLSDPGTTVTPWHDSVLYNVTTGYFGVTMPSYGRSRASFELLNISPRGFYRLFKNMWGLATNLELSLLTSVPRTMSTTIWTQSGKHLSPAPYGVVATTPLLVLEQGTISRKALCKRAQRQNGLD